MATALFATSKLLHSPRWMITDNESGEVVGSVGLYPITHSQMIKLIYENDENNIHVAALGLLLKKAYWEPSKTRPTLTTFLTKIFTTHSILDGIAVCINKDHQLALNCVRDAETNSATPPFTYCGQAHFPDGYTTILPKAFNGDCYLVKKETLLQNSLH